MAERHQAEEHQVKYSLVALSSLHARTHATSVRWSWWYSPSVRPGVSGCRVAAWHLRKERLRLALAASQGGFQEALHGGSAGATQFATAARALCSPAGLVESTNRQRQPARSLSCSRSF